VPGVDASGPRVLTRDEQQRVLSDVERQFVAGLRRKDGRTVGLGL
jgi:collagen type VII alpha